MKLQTQSKQFKANYVRRWKEMFLICFEMMSVLELIIPAATTIKTKSRFTNFVFNAYEYTFKVSAKTT